MILHLLSSITSTKLVEASTMTTPSPQCQTQIDKPEYQRLNALTFLQTNDALENIYEYCSTGDDDISSSNGIGKNITSDGDIINCYYDFTSSTEAGDVRSSCYQIKDSEIEYIDLDMECNETIQSLDEIDEVQVIGMKIEMKSVPQCISQSCDGDILRKSLEYDIELLSGCDVINIDAETSARTRSEGLSKHYGLPRWYKVALSIYIINLFL